MNKEKDLIKRLQSNKHKEKAFSELLDAYQERLYWHIRKLVITHQNANDVLQNTFIRIFKNINTFKEQSTLHTWMFRIAYNESIRFLDKEKKKKALLNTDFTNNYLHVISQDSYFDGDDITLKLHTIINTLTDKQKQVFQMKYFDELSFREISELLNISENTLKSSYYTTEKKIKDHLVRIK